MMHLDPVVIVMAFKTITTGELYGAVYEGRGSLANRSDGAY